MFSIILSQVSYHFATPLFRCLSNNRKSLLPTSVSMLYSSRQAVVVDPARSLSSVTIGHKCTSSYRPRKKEANRLDCHVSVSNRVLMDTDSCEGNLSCPVTCCCISLIECDSHTTRDLTSTDATSIRLILPREQRRRRFTSIFCWARIRSRTCKRSGIDYTVKQSYVAIREERTSAGEEEEDLEESTSFATTVPM